MNAKTLMYRLALSAFFISCIFSTNLIAQSENEEVISEKSLLGINFSYGPALMKGDLSDRFSRGNDIGLGVDYITMSSWIYGIGANYYFGDNVKENVIANLVSNIGFIISGENLLADVFLRMRALKINALVGKIIPLGKNPKSGIRLTLAGGILQHQIRLQDETNSAPQIGGAYGEGYDRLTSGWSVSEFVGYQHLATDKRLNIFAGVEFTQAFTKSQRPVDFDTKQTDHPSRLDLVHSFRVGITLPFYTSQKTQGDIYY